MGPTTEPDSLKSPFTLSQWLLVAVGTGLSGFLASGGLQAGGRTVSPLWITAGVSMAFFVCYGWRAASAVVSGHLALGWLTAPDRQMWATFGLAAIFAAEGWLASVAGYRNRRMTAGWRCLAVAMLCAVPGALLATAVLTFSGGIAADSSGSAALLIALSHAQGLVAFGGLTLHLLRRDFSLEKLKHERNGALAGIAALAAAGLAFQGFSNGFLAAGSAALLPLPLLVIAAFQLSPAPASLLAALWCVSVTALAYAGMGPFAIDATGMDFAELGVYNIVMVAVIYLVAVESSGLRKAEAITMARGYQEAKLHNLQANLSPHFLFNTLNVIRALVYADPAKADQAITSLASLLRRSLRTSGVSLINLGEELERIEVLLRLARLRYHDRLQTHIHVPDQLLETLVPPMLLFNLVENAITHGIGSLELGGMITISARATRDQVHISIRNSGTLDGNATRGNGTQDALQRLEMLFGGRAKFSLSQMDEKTVSADVDLPLSPTYQL